MNDPTCFKSADVAFHWKKVQLCFDLIMGSDLVENRGKANATVIYVLISTIQAWRFWVLWLVLSLLSAELIKHSAQYTLYFSSSLVLRKLPCCQKSHTNKRCTWTALALFTLGKKLSFFLSNPGHTCAGCLRGSIVGWYTFETEGALTPNPAPPSCYLFLLLRQWYNDVSIHALFNFTASGVDFCTIHSL